MYGMTHQGLKRRRNEDDFFIHHEGLFAILADGMGGHNGGNIASSQAVKKFQQEIPLIISESKTKSELNEKIKNLYKKISEEICEQGIKDLSLTGMGTTAIVWLEWKKNVFLSYIGDSRTYLLCNDELYQVTWDHNAYNESISRGIFPDQRLRKMNTHSIYRVLGSQHEAIPTLSLFPKENSLWMMCSDGITDLLSYLEIFEILRQKMGIEEKVKNLISEGCRRGGHDNMTVVIIECS
jgi:protein phosphatase